MNVSSSTETTLTSAPRLAVPLFDNDTGPPAAVKDTPLGTVLGRLIAAKLVGGGLGDVTPILGAADLGAEVVHTFGLGKRAAFGAGPAFDAGVALSKRLAGKSTQGPVAVLVPDA